MFLTGKVIWEADVTRGPCPNMAGTPCSRCCFCLSYLIPLDLILLRSATSRNIKMVGSVSILFCFVFFFFYPLGSTCHPYFGYLISTCYWTSGAPRSPLRFPVSVILMPNHTRFICQFSVAAVATALMATATGTIFSGPLHSCSSCCAVFLGSGFLVFPSWAGSHRSVMLLPPRRWAGGLLIFLRNSPLGRVTTGSYPHCEHHVGV